jgi:hypothetical protein
VCIHVSDFVHHNLRVLEKAYLEIVCERERAGSALRALNEGRGQDHDTPVDDAHARTGILLAVYL